MFLTFVIFFVIFLILLNRYLLTYWSRRGVPQQDGTFLFGNISGMFTLKASMVEIFADFYKKYKQHKVFGFYLSYRRAMIINDPQLIQDILIRDFNSFHDRGFPVNEEVDPLSAHLFSLGGQKWRDLRVKLSPTFTSGKLKGMFPTIRDCAKVLDDYLVKNVKDGKNIFEFRDLLARLTTNIISSVAFGVENDSINDWENIFRKMSSQVFEPSLEMAVKRLLFLFVPDLFIFFNIRGIKKTLEDFVFSLLRQTIEYREKNNVERKDLMQLLIQLKNEGYIPVDRDEENKEEYLNRKEKRKLTLNEIAAQTYLFFVAGFETSSSTMSYCLLELCKNPGIQVKVQNEIDQILKTSDINDLTYEMLHEMKYLECCIDETLRKYPIAPFLFREATKDYTFRDTNVNIKKGTTVYIPLLGLQRDENIYDDPLNFKPERFLDSPHGNGKVAGSFYLPFGDGPRNCIGARMGKLQTKIGLVSVLSKFTVELTDESMAHQEMTFDKTNHFILAPDKPFDLKVTLRK